MAGKGQAQGLPLLQFEGVGGKCGMHGGRGHEHGLAMRFGQPPKK